MACAHASRRAPCALGSLGATGCAARQQQTAGGGAAPAGLDRLASFICFGHFSRHICFGRFARFASRVRPAHRANLMRVKNRIQFPRTRRASLHEPAGRWQNHRGGLAGPASSPQSTQTNRHPSAGGPLTAWRWHGRWGCMAAGHTGHQACGESCCRRRTRTRNRTGALGLVALATRKLRFRPRGRWFLAGPTDRARLERRPVWPKLHRAARWALLQHRQRAVAGSGKVKGSLPWAAGNEVCGMARIHSMEYSNVTASIKAVSH